MSAKETVYTYINSLGFKDFKKVMDSLHRRYPLEEVVTDIDADVYKLVGKETFSEFLCDSLFSMGSHGHDHINLNMLSQEELADQLAASKRILETHTKDTVNAIAFPYGYFNEDVVKSATEQGYRYMLAGGSVGGEWRQQVFPRIGILNMAGYAFNMLSISRGFRHFGF